MPTTKLYRPLRGPLQVSRNVHPRLIATLRGERQFQSPDPVSGNWLVQRTRSERTREALLEQYGTLEVYEDWNLGVCDQRCRRGRPETVHLCVCVCRGVHHGGSAGVERPIGETAVLLVDRTRTVHTLVRA